MPRESPIECHNCGECNYTSFEGELWCDGCAFSPDRQNRRLSLRSAWDQWFHARKKAAQRGARPYCVGGNPNAYKGDGEYEFDEDDEDEFVSPPDYKLRPRNSWRS